MNWKRGIGLSLIILSGIIGWTNSITGAVIGTSSSASLIPILMFIVGLVLVIVGSSLDQITKEVYTEEVTEEHHKAHNQANYERLKRRYSRVGYRVPPNFRQYESKYGKPPSSEKESEWITLYHGKLRNVRGELGENGKLIGSKKRKGGGLFLAEDIDSIEQEFPGFSREDLTIYKIRISKKVYDGLGIKESQSQLAQNKKGESSKVYKLMNRKIKLANDLFQGGYIQVQR